MPCRLLLGVVFQLHLVCFYILHVAPGLEALASVRGTFAYACSADKLELPTLNSGHFVSLSSCLTEVVRTATRCFLQGQELK